jgi:hypothetical protein
MTAVCALSLLLCVVLAAPLSAQERDTLPRATRPPIQQGVTPLDTAVGPRVRVRLGADSTVLPTLRLPSVLSRAERETYRQAAAQIEAARATAFQQNMRTILESVWGQVATSTFATSTPGPVFPGELPAKPKPVAARASDIINQYSDIGLQLNGRLEVRGEKNQSASCGGAFVNPLINCRTAFEPLLDFQFSALSGGVVAERVHVNLDYDTQREFDASNNISIYYEGKGGEFIQRLEAGNVTFQPPSSRFITAGIPSGNYGVQAIAKLGSMRLKTIAAQQKGNIVRDRVFTVGDRTLQAIDRKIEDYQFEPRRFFFIVPPKALGSAYPNIDILDTRRLQTLAAKLPDTLRPTKLFLYRLVIGGQPPNPAGPQFRILGDPRSRRGQVYEYLREGIDYYADPSLLWIALVRPLALSNERLVVAYRVRINGRDTTYVSTGGTPDLEYRPGREQFANLLWDPQVKPGDPAFEREIRSVYRVGGADVRRQSIVLKVVTGSGADQEKPISTFSPLTGQLADTYLQLFGLAQSTNTSSFDIENRIWPRPGDPNFELSLGNSAARTIRDQFLVFPSLRPFAKNGLAGQNPANDTVYTTPAEYLNSPQRPQALYHIRVRYQSESGGDGGTLMLGAVQLRQNSERLLVEGVPLVRGTDYTIDYDLGRVTFNRADTLFPRPRQVTVQYEENPLFAQTPTSILGATAEFPFDNGQIAFTAISQTQKTSFNRPPLGFEPAASLVGGVTALFSFDATPLTRLVSRMPQGETTVPSRIGFSAEFAASRPRPNAAGQAYIESFEGEGGVRVSLNDLNWYYSSQPSLGHGLLGQYGIDVVDLKRAATLAWQSNGLDAGDRPVRYSIEQIDPLASLIGAGASGPEQLLWMTLYPLSVGGLRDSVSHDFRWKIAGAPTGRRWRSIRTVLSPSGTDLSRAENLEFWAQINVSGKRDKNPILVFDFGDVSENTVSYGPDTLYTKQRVPAAGSSDLRTQDTTYFGKTLQRYDQLDSERDEFSRTFNAGINDRGLPGDVVSPITIVNDGPSGRTVSTRGAWPTCLGGYRTVQILGDANTDCTVGNNHLDEEDIDGDGVLNLTSSEREQEQIDRYVINLADPAKYTRIGKCSPAPVTQIPTQPDSVCWVLVRVPFQSPDDSLGNPLRRRTRALRITMISGAGLGDNEFGRIALARLRLTGAPWLKRSPNAVKGIAGEDPSLGFVQAGVIGTQDRNLTNGVSYESPPGVVDAPDQKSSFEAGRIQVNERSLRLTAAQVQRYERAEAYYRFPEGERNFMAYNELRLWARGVKNGWGQNGELQFYVKIGRDANNFYMYRTPLVIGDTKLAWEPEVRVNFQKLYDLRAQVQNAYLQNTQPNTCTGLDSVLIANTPLPPGRLGARRFAACADGYVVYTIDPGSAPPNLAGVQELAVGMVRVANGTGLRPIAPSDTLELWVDDIRLGGVVDQAGFAGQVGLSVIASDFADVRLNVVRRDPHFRQLAEQPTFLTDNSINFTSAFHLEKMLPKRFGLSIPFTINHTAASSDPLFVSQSDIAADIVQGLRTPKSSATSVTLSVRRSTPSNGTWYAPIVNNLSLNSTYTSGRARSEYENGRADNVSVGLDYNLSRALMPNLSRWNPVELHLTSVYVAASDSRLSFLKPADASDDPARLVAGLTRSWKNGGSFVLKPFKSAAFRWDISSVRDLRNYGTESTLGVITASDRGRDRLLGAEAGIERERAMQAGFNYAPALSFWIRPRIDFGTSYNMLRDPNTPSYLRLNDSTGAFRLPRRLGNSQTSSAGLTFDIPRALKSMDSTTLLHHFLRGFQPIDVNMNRSLISVFDGTPVTPPISYQLAIGGTNLFRSISGREATSTGVVTQLSANNTINLPGGAIFSNRYQRINTRNWTRRYESDASIFDGTQVMFPDLTLRWSSKPGSLRSLVNSISTSARYVETRQYNTAPPFASFELSDNPDLVDRGVSLVRSYPLNTTIVWAGDRPFSSSFGFSLNERRESRPGMATNGSTADWSADVAKPFKLPHQWNMPGDLRTRLSYQATHGDNFIFNPLAEGLRSRLSDNGRRSFNFSADTDVSENLSSSLVISRLVSFDRNLNRNFTQTVLSAVMHLQFFGGELK